MADPILGEIRLFPYERAPGGWHRCDGALLPINAANRPLFSLIGTTYGGDGVQNFRLPDLRGRVPVGTSSSTSSPLAIGTYGGLEKVVLTAENLPQHSHFFTATSLTGTTSVPGGNYLAVAQTTSKLDHAVKLYATVLKGGRFIPLNPDMVAETGGVPRSSPLSLPDADPPAGPGQPDGGRDDHSAQAERVTLGHDNMQPFLALAYFIALTGTVPRKSGVKRRREGAASAPRKGATKGQPSIKAG